MLRWPRMLRGWGKKRFHWPRHYARGGHFFNSPLFWLTAADIADPAAGFGAHYNTVVVTY